MPVSIKRGPFAGPPPETGLRVPQARVLRALVPEYPTDPKSEWPLLSRAALGVRAGYTAISGTITRALNGIQPGSSSGDPHVGLIGRGLVEEVRIDVDGTVEINYRATDAGVRTFVEYVKVNGDKLPPLKDQSSCVNDRYKET